MRFHLVILPLACSLGACMDIPRADAPRRQTVRQSTAVISPRPDYRQCLSQLGAQQAVFTPVADQYFGTGCSTLGTVRLTSLQDDRSSLSLANMGPVTCGMASTFAAWARYGVGRAAEQILGSRVVRIETYGSYNCRNVAGSSRRSGHATASAIDVSGFVLANGNRISVLDDWAGGTPAEKRFLRVVHASACKRFGTTLGPDYNPAHANHFHLEAGGTAYCR